MPRLTLCTSCLLAVGLAWGSTALAAPSAEATASIAPPRSAQLLAAEGKALLDAGRPAEAATRLQEAWKLQPLPMILLWLGIAQEAAGDVEACLSTLDRYLDLASSEAANLQEMARRKRDRCATLTDRIRPLVTFESEPPAAAIYLFPAPVARSGPVGTTPFQLRLPPGEHGVRAIRRDSAEHRERFTVTAGASRTMRFLLAAPSGSGRLVLDAQVPGTEVLLDGVTLGRSPVTDTFRLRAGRHVLGLQGAGCVSSRSVDVTAGADLTLRVDACEPLGQPLRWQPIAGWTGVGVGTAAVLGGIFVHLWARQLESDWTGAATFSEQRRIQSDRDTAWTTAWVLYGVGGAVAAAGAGVLLWDLKTAGKTEATPTVGGLLVTHRF